MENRTPLIYVPIEPLEERYTASWYRNFPPVFTNLGYDVLTIDGQELLSNDIKVGTFLDINSTTYYKWSQLQQIARMFHEGQVKDGTVFFFGDLEFWGIESIRLMADMNKVQVYLTAFLHAASYTREDAFAVAAPYQRFTEVGWVAAMDKVFVGSRYHKQAFIKRRLAPLNAEDLAHKLIVTKNPLFPEDYPVYPDIKKEKKVLLTNRFDNEKRPQETIALFRKLKADFPDWQFVVTTGRKSLRSTHEELTDLARQAETDGIITIKAGLTKDEYHRELASAKVMVSHSIEENYGLCIAEALIYGCIPVLRRGLSHDEFPALFFDNTGTSSEWDYREQPAYGTDHEVLTKALLDLDNGTNPGVTIETFKSKEGLENILRYLEVF